MNLGNRTQAAIELGNSPFVFRFKGLFSVTSSVNAHERIIHFKIYLGVHL